jgi:general L-amino acid transport system substrate-binding protein
MNQLSILIAAGAGVALTWSAADAQTLNQIKQRGQVICDSNTNSPGFSLPDPQGNWTGLDVDYCGAIAATYSPQYHLDLIARFCPRPRFRGHELLRW